MRFDGSLAKRLTPDSFTASILAAQRSALTVTKTCPKTSCTGLGARSRALIAQVALPSYVYRWSGSGVGIGALSSMAIYFALRRPGLTSPWWLRRLPCAKTAPCPPPPLPTLSTLVSSVGLRRIQSATGCRVALSCVLLPDCWGPRGVLQLTDGNSKTAAMSIEVIAAARRYLRELGAMWAPGWPTWHPPLAGSTGPLAHAIHIASRAYWHGPACLRAVYGAAPAY